MDHHRVQPDLKHALIEAFGLPVSLAYELSRELCKKEYDFTDGSSNNDVITGEMCYLEGIGIVEQLH